MLGSSSGRLQPCSYQGHPQRHFFVSPSTLHVGLSSDVDVHRFPRELLGNVAAYGVHLVPEVTLLNSLFHLNLHRLLPPLVCCHHFFFLE